MEYDASLNLYAKMKLKSVESLRLLLLWHWDMRAQLTLTQALQQWVAGSMEEFRDSQMEAAAVYALEASRKMRGAQVMRSCAHRWVAQDLAQAVRHWSTKYLATYLSASSRFQASASILDVKMRVGLTWLAHSLPGRASAAKVLLAVHTFRANWQFSTATDSLSESLDSTTMTARAHRRNAQLMLSALSVRLDGDAARGRTIQALGAWRAKHDQHRVGVEREAQLRWSSQIHKSGQKYTALCQMRALQAMATIRARQLQGALQRAVSGWSRNELKDTRRMTVHELLAVEHRLRCSKLHAAYPCVPDTPRELLLRWAVRSAQHSGCVAQDMLADDNARVLADLATGAMFSRGMQVMKTIAHRMYRGSLSWAVHAMQLQFEASTSAEITRRHLLRQALRRAVAGLVHGALGVAVHDLKRGVATEREARLLERKRMESMLVQLGALEHVRLREEQQHRVGLWRLHVQHHRVAQGCGVEYSKRGALERLGFVLRRQGTVVCLVAIQSWRARRLAERRLAAGMLRTMVCVAKLQAQVWLAGLVLGWRLQQHRARLQQGHVQKQAERQRFQDNMHRRDMSKRLAHQRAAGVLRSFALSGVAAVTSRSIHQWRSTVAATAARRVSGLGRLRMAVHGVGLQELGRVFGAWVQNQIREEAVGSIMGVRDAYKQARLASRHHRAFAATLNRLQLWSLASVQRAVCTWMHRVDHFSARSLALARLSSLLQAGSVQRASRCVLSWRAAASRNRLMMRAGCQALRSFLWRNIGTKDLVAAWRSKAKLWHALGSRGLRMLASTVRGDRLKMLAETVAAWKAARALALDSFGQALSMLTGLYCRRHTKALKLAWVGLVMGWKASKRPAKKPARKPAKREEVKAPMGQAWARCVEQFAGFEERDLDLKLGDMVAVLEPSSNPIWEGICGGREGRFPKDAVELLSPGQLGQVDNNGRAIRHSVELHDEVDRLEAVRALELKEHKQVKRTNKSQLEQLQAAARARHLEALFALWRELQRSWMRQQCGRAVLAWLLESRMEQEQMQLEELTSKVLAHNAYSLGLQTLHTVFKQQLKGRIASCLHVWFQSSIAWQTDMQLKQAGEEMELCLEFKDLAHGLSVLARHIKGVKEALCSLTLVHWRQNKADGMLVMNQSIVEDCMLEVVSQNNVMLGLRLLSYQAQRELLHRLHAHLFAWAAKVRQAQAALQTYSKILRRWTEQWIKVKLRSWKVLASLAKNPRARPAPRRAATTQPASMPPGGSPDTRLADRARSMRQGSRRQRLSLHEEATSEA